MYQAARSFLRLNGLNYLNDFNELLDGSEIMAGVIDADTHIAESEAMWEFIDREMYPRRPILAKIPDDTWYKDRNAFWLIDGEIFPKPAGKGSFSLITPSAAKREAGRGDIHLAVRELTDPIARLKDMDRIAVEVGDLSDTFSGVSH